MKYAAIAAGIALLFAFPPISGHSTVSAQTVKQVGDDQPVLQKLADVAAEVNAGVGDNTIYELDAAYDGSAGETFPIVFSNATLFTVTIRVGGGVAGRVTSGVPGVDTSLIIVNGGSGITFDGRPGGSGSSAEWSIVNLDASTVHPTILLAGGASGTALRYLRVGGDNSGLQGVVCLDGSSVSTSGNTVDNCTVRNAAGGTPRRGIAITAGGWPALNLNNTISNNRIFNIMAPADTDAIAPILVERAGGTTVSGNHVYWEDDYSSLTLSAPVQGILVRKSVPAAGNTVSGNFIGGSAPSAGGVVREFSSAAIFNGISVENDSNTTPVEIQGNTVSKIGFNTSLLESHSFALIRLHSGKGNLGTSAGNTIGAAAGTGSIVMTAKADQLAGVSAFISESRDSVRIENNIIGAITLTIETGSSAPAMELIRVPEGGTTIIRSNTIGNADPDNLVINNTKPGGTRTAHRGIRVNGTSFSLVISGNVVQNVRLLSAAAPVDFVGIEQRDVVLPPRSVVSGNVVRNIRQTGGALSSFTGIFSAAGGASAVLNSIAGNRIDSITSAGSGHHAGILYNGAAVSGAPTTITGDTVRNWTMTGDGVVTGIEGSDTADFFTIQDNLITSISLGPPSGTAPNASFAGIRAVRGEWTISGNTVSGVTTTSTDTAGGASSALVGVDVASDSGGRALDRNTVFSLAANPADGSARVGICGVVIRGAGGGSAGRNRIHSLSSASTGSPNLNGIVSEASGASEWLVSNNMISAGNGVTAGAAIRGILEQGSGSGANAYYYNSVSILGAASAGTSPTIAFERASERPAAVRNNIFSNARTGGSGGHVAVANGDTAGWTASTSDYNVLTSSSASTVGRWLGASRTLAAWKSSSGGDAASKSKAVDFVSATDLHLGGFSVGDMDITGVPLSAVTTDIDGDSRNPDFPYDGADEHPENPLPVTLASFVAETAPGGGAVVLSWSTLSEVNNYGFTVERRRQGSGIFESASGLIPGAGTSIQKHDYSWTDWGPAPGTVVYRLRQIDLNGDASYSVEISVTLSGVLGVAPGTLPPVFSLDQNYPNPFNPATSISYSLERAGFTMLVVYNTLGQAVAALVGEFQQAGPHSAMWDAGELPSGAYLMRLRSGSSSLQRRQIFLK